MSSTCLSCGPSQAVLLSADHSPHCSCSCTFCCFVSEKARAGCPESVYTACPGNWTGFVNKCFYFSEDTRNWTHSQAFCKALGAELAQFENLEELNSLRRYTVLLTTGSACTENRHKSLGSGQTNWVQQLTEPHMRSEGSEIPGSHCRAAGVRLNSTLHCCTCSQRRLQGAVGTSPKVSASQRTGEQFLNCECSHFFGKVKYRDPITSVTVEFPSEEWENAPT